MNIKKFCLYALSVFSWAMSSMAFAASSSSSSSSFLHLIQAETYTGTNGVQKEATNDVNGGMHVSSIDTGDWISYFGVGVNIPVSGSYRITYRVSGSGGFKFKESSQTGNTIYDTVAIPATGGNWIDLTRNITLTAGTHHFGMTVHSGGFKLNWFKIESTPASSSSSSKTSSKFSSNNSSSSIAATLLFSQDFESLILPAEWAAYNGGTAIINTNTAQNHNGSAGSLKGSYPLGEGVFVQGAYDLTPYTIGASNHVYIDFYAKMPNSKQGLKFCKLFGTNSGANYANTTFALDYTGADRGGMVYVAFGDGDPLTNSVENDTANGVWLAGINDWDAPYHGVGRSKNIAQIQTPQNAIWSSSNWGTGWHRFQFYLKFNSGTTQANEINDGEILVIIDGVTYVDAKGLFNRHYSNGPLNHIHLLEYAQGATSPFDVWVDSVRISQNGWTR